MRIKNLEGSGVNICDFGHVEQNEDNENKDIASFRSMLLGSIDPHISVTTM